MKPSKLLRHLNTKHPGLRSKHLEYIEGKEREHEGQKKFLRAITSIKENALRASYLMANRIAMAENPLPIGETLNFPSTKDICREMLGEAAVQKTAHVALMASTVTRSIMEIVEDIDTHSVQRINTSLSRALQVDEFTDIDNEAVLLVHVRYIYQEHLLCTLSLPTNTTGTQMFK